MAKEILAELQKSEPNAQVECDVQDNVVARGDPRLLRIVLVNLLGNAWKFTGKTDRAEIEFGVVNRGGPAVFFIRDNGAGFDMAYSQKLFGAFQRLHAASDFRHGRGSGDRSANNPSARRPGLGRGSRGDGIDIFIHARRCSGASK